MEADEPTRDGLMGAVLGGKYRITGTLGSGGFATVYRAVQESVDRPVAVKVLRPDVVARVGPGGRLTDRFRREALATSRLQHPNTVRLIDFGETEDGLLYLVLELLEGALLLHELRRVRVMPGPRAAHVLGQVCKSLSEAHDQGLVHRDLKPSNVFLCEYAGEPDFVRVTDFGIAGWTDQAPDGERLTETGTIQGTPHYMAPEQVMALPVGPAADLYALGVMAWEMLTGRVPFDAESAMAVGVKHVHEPLPALELPGMPADQAAAWRPLLASLLAKKPEERPPSAAAVAAALATLAGAPGPNVDPEGDTIVARAPVDTLGETTPAGEMAAPTQESRRPRRAVVGAAAAAAVAGLFLASWLLSHGDASQEQAPRRQPCSEDHDTACDEGFVAWCDGGGEHLACCLRGLMATGDTDGTCACPPGGTGRVEAVRAGCPAGDPAGFKAAIRETFREGRTRFKACYDQALGANARLGGKLKLHLVLGPDGEQYEARLLGASLPDPVAQRCVLDVVRSLSFPAPVGGAVTVAYPLVFRPDEAPAAGEPLRGGVVRVGVEASISADLDVYAHVESYERHVARLVTERFLLRTPGGATAPGPIERWDLDETGLRLTLGLRDGVRFSPHPCLPGGQGRVATAEDVRASLVYARSRGALVLPVAGDDAFAVVDGATVAVTLSEPTAFAARALEDVWLFPAEAIGCDASPLHPAGSAAFELAERTPEGRVVLRRHDGHWKRDEAGRALPFVDGAELIPYDTTADAVARLHRGDLHVVLLSREDTAPWLVDPGAEHPALKPEVHATGVRLGLPAPEDAVRTLSIVPLRPDRGPLADRAVRRAVALAVDRDAIVAADPALVAPVGRIFDSATLGYDPALRELTTDRAGARAVLKRARGASEEILLGWPGSADVVARRVAEDLRAVGLSVRTVRLSGDELRRQVQGGAVDAVIGQLGISRAHGEPFGLLRLAHDSQGLGLLRAAEWQEATAGIARTLDRERRRERYAELERRLLDDLPVIPLARLRTVASTVYLYHRSLRGAFDDVTGYELDWAGGELDRVWLSD